jgi:acetone carboxylase gamma subunit
MKIDYHHRAWCCPKCQEYHRVRHLGSRHSPDTRIAKCRCGYSVIVTTELQESITLDVVLVNCEARL